MSYFSFANNLQSIYGSFFITGNPNATIMSHLFVCFKIGSSQENTVVAYAPKYT